MAASILMSPSPPPFPPPSQPPPLPPTESYLAAEFLLLLLPVFVLVGALGWCLWREHKRQPLLS